MTGQMIVTPASAAASFCTKCGAALVPGASFCTSCGHPATVGSAAKTPGRLDPNLLHRGRLWGWLAFVLSIGALNLLGTLLAPPASLHPALPAAFNLTDAISGFVVYGIFMGLLLLLARGFPFRETFALRRPNSWWSVVWIVPLTLFVMLILSAVVEHFLHPGRAQGATPDHWVSGHILAYVLNIIVAAVCAPVVEELTFRGLGYTLLRPFGTGVAILVVGLTFGLAHGLLVALPVLVPFGCALAYMRSRMNSVYPGMIVHGCFNAFAMLAILFTR